jgi:hypothetical protein
LGLFDFPRIHVFGQHRVNPGTGNNNSASPGEELTVTSNSERVQAIDRGLGDAEFRRWMTELDALGALRAQWNYYGDMSFSFTDVSVRSVQLGPDDLRIHSKPERAGPRVGEKYDPLIGAKVFLNNAIVCDTNPEGFNSTQIFAEALELHAPHLLQRGSFLSRQPSRATTRWLNWQRNVSYHGRFEHPSKEGTGLISSGGAGGASATFQCSIEVTKADLKLDEPDKRSATASRHKLICEEDTEARRVERSPGLDALLLALQRDDALGLVFRYNLHLCSPRISDTDLARRFAAGERPENPAYGLLVGTIAPWYKGEPSTVTLGRLLKPTRSYPNPYKVTRAQWELSPAIAAYDAVNERLSIDLANCLPEDGPDGDKYNLGTIKLGVRTPTPKGTDPALHDAPPLWLGLPLQNDREHYRDRGGIYDVHVDGLAPDVLKRLEADELVLHTELAGVLLYEPEFAIATDCNCLYLDELPPDRCWSDQAVQRELEAQPDPALTGRFDLQLRQRGHEPPASVTVRVEEWRETPTGLASNFGAYRLPILLRSFEIDVQHGGHELVLRPSEGTGLRIFRFVPEGSWPQEISADRLARVTLQESIVQLRILPYDDYSHIREEELTADRIFHEIFRYYHLITPAMSQALDLSDSTIWQLPSAARYVLLTTSTEMWSSWQFMPRTRDLSRSRRELLQRFCRSILELHAQSDR